ncbi:DUF6655 family protein [Tundrisphaera lichenicola]|uniref:DUF6655 family protein n=1 Tax=Tundrisphaera lichenicola TaxID=2029860 RepID=UPI003EC0984B
MMGGTIMGRQASSRRTIRAIVLLGGLMAAGSAGCSTIKSTGTARSGTEQLLLTGAWDAALCRVDFRPLADRRVFLDPRYVTVVDKDWVISSIRRTLARQGALLEDDRAKAEVVVEPSVGAYGTDERSCKVGLPNIAALPTMLGFPSLATASTSTSSLNAYQSNQQDAVVKAAFFGYDAKTGRIIWESGPLMNAEGVRDRYVFGTGPNRLASQAEVEHYPPEAESRVRRRFVRRLTGK